MTTHLMEPLLPETRAIEPLAIALAAEAGALGSAFPSIVKDSIAELLRTINTYHSNLIEGHDTRPRDILRAMAGNYSRDPERRALQLEARAHVEVQRLVESRLAAQPGLDVAAPDFISWLHAEFYHRMPDELRRVQSHSGARELLVEPGAWRREDVDVGRHLPPDFAGVPAFMNRFHEGYALEKLHGIERIAAIPASHHRLLWIHPFIDGNGRVARLFTDAFLRRAGLGGHGLWAASRGLARGRERYLALLEAADSERQGDHDGRGARSRRALTEFCIFFLETCLDQVRYMRTLLDTETLVERMRAWVAVRGAARRLPADAWKLLAEPLRRGELPRGEAARVLNTSDRTARRVVSIMVSDGLLTSATPKGPLRLGFPAAVLEYYFPLLAPG